LSLLGVCVILSWHSFLRLRNGAEIFAHNLPIPKRELRIALKPHPRRRIGGTDSIIQRISRNLRGPAAACSSGAPAAARLFAGQLHARPIQSHVFIEQSVAIPSTVSTANAHGRKNLLQR